MLAVYSSEGAIVAADLLCPLFFISAGCFLLPWLVSAGAIWVCSREPCGAGVKWFGFPLVHFISSCVPQKSTASNSWEWPGGKLVQSQYPSTLGTNTAPSSTAPRSAGFIILPPLLIHDTHLKHCAEIKHCHATQALWAASHLTCHDSRDPCLVPALVHLIGG